MKKLSRKQKRLSFTRLLFANKVTIDQIFDWARSTKDYDRRLGFDRDLFTEALITDCSYPGKGYMIIEQHIKKVRPNIFCYTGETYTWYQWKRLIANHTGPIEQKINILLAGTGYVDIELFESGCLFSAREKDPEEEQERYQYDITFWKVIDDLIANAPQQQCLQSTSYYIRETRKKIDNL
jgi:hypothetical protein